MPFMGIPLRKYVYVNSIFILELKILQFYAFQTYA